MTYRSYVFDSMSDGNAAFVKQQLGEKPRRIGGVTSIL